MKTFTIDEILGRKTSRSSSSRSKSTSSRKKRPRPSLRIITSFTKPKSKPIRSFGNDGISISKVNAIKADTKKNLQKVLMARLKTQKKNFKSYSDYIKTKKVLDKVLL